MNSARRLSESSWLRHNISKQSSIAYIELSEADMSHDDSSENTTNSTGRNREEKLVEVEDVEKQSIEKMTRGCELKKFESPRNATYNNEIDY